MDRNTLKRALLNPLEVGLGVIASRRPQWLLRRYASFARKQGLSQPSLLLSFDCDTDRDAEVAEEVNGRLAESGVYPVYAVPGKNLERNASVYSRIAEKGYEFINHGYADHAYWDDGAQAYRSCTFYDRLTPSKVVEDIERGHRVHLDLFGKAPTGFRGPHFGTFQKRPHLRLLYKTLHRLGYRYSTSTLPNYGFIHGPLHRLRQGLVEIPVTGCFDTPLIVLDSWAFFAAPDRQFESRDYQTQLLKLVDFFVTRELPCLLNLYVDPSHVAERLEFFEAIRHAAERMRLYSSYRELLESDA